MRVGGGVVAAVLVLVAPGAADAQEAPGPGSLTVEAAPAEVTAAAGTALVRVANGGGSPVTGVTVEAVPPDGTTVTPRETRLGTLPAGGSTLVELRLGGTPGVVAVRADGTAGAVAVAAAATVELTVPAPSTIAIVGNTRLTERSPADLQVVVTNAGDTTAEVELTADAGDHTATLERTSLSVAPRSAERVGLTVEADDELRRGAVGVVVRAEVAGDGTQDVVATRELEVALAADALPGPLGVGSMLVLPGLVALLAFFEVRASDRRRIGARHPGAKAVWDDKTWILLGGIVSLAAAAVYTLVAGRDLLDVYELSDIAVLTIVVGALGAGAALVANWQHRRDVPAVVETSPVTDVLRAAARSSGSVTRRRYKVGDRYGLLVQRDGAALVLSPPICFESGGPVRKAFDDTKDPDRFAKAVAAMPADFDGRFDPGADDIAGPIVVEQAVEAGQGDLLVYKG
ncbi:MAG TPA: hypothetical protein VGB14_08650 [Acidimicrobiales bacterium]